MTVLDDVGPTAFRFNRLSDPSGFLISGVAVSECSAERVGREAAHVGLGQVGRIQEVPDPGSDAAKRPEVSHSVPTESES